jgi:hypothetical protein
MHPTFHHSEDSNELLEVLSLSRSQWIRFEERHDHRQEIIQSPYVVDEQILSMIVVPAVALDLAASEVLLNKLEHSDTSLTLNDRESGLALPPQRHLTISLYRAAEAAFPVDEADDPLLDT